MDSNLLKIFIAVCRTKSISHAAKELHYAQSNVTTRIIQLEKSIGHVLFHRVAKGVVLTEAGEELYVYAKEIVDKLERTEQLFLHKHHKGRLKIAATESNAATKVVPFLATLSEAYPQMDLELLTGTSEDVYRILEEYQADVGFVCGEPDGKKFTILKRFEEEMVIVKPLQKKGNKRVLSFKKGCAYKKYLHTYLQEQGLEYKSIEFSSFETILGCVKAGMGMTLLPLSVVQKLGYEKDVQIEKAPEKFRNLPTYMICQKENEPSISGFLQQL